MTDVTTATATRSGTDTTATDPTYPDATMRYGTVGSQVADVFEPAEAVDSMVLLLHGGFWDESDRMRTWAVGRAISEAGHLCATVQYRTGGWEAALDDAVTAIEQIQLSGREWTIHNDAPRRTTLVGHSSGGQLALWAASRTSLPTTSRWYTPAPRITGAVALAPAADLATMAADGIGGDAVARFLGGTPAEVPDAYAAADPAALVPGVPVEVLHGADDTVIPPALSEGYARHLRDAGAEGWTLDVVDGVGHTDWGTPGTPAFQRLTAAIDRLTA